MRAVAGAAAVVATLAALSGAARGQSPADLFDSDVQVVIAGSPNDIAAAVASFSALGHSLSIGIARQGIKTALGWDPIDPSAWRDRGFDPAGEIWLALSVDDGAARYKALSSAVKWDAKTASSLPATFWHLRMVAPVVAPRRAGRVASGWAATFALGSGNVRVSQRGKLLVVDALRPMFHGAVAAPKASDVTTRARPPQPDQRFDRKGLFGTSGLRGWMRAGALIAIGRAQQRESHIEIQRSPGGAGLGPVAAQPQMRRARRAGRRSLVSRSSWRLSPGPTVEVILGADQGDLVAAFPRASKPPEIAHRLPGVTGAVAIRMASFGGLRALPRAGVLRSFTDALAHIDGCEPHYGWSARLFGWPHMMGLWLAEIAALGPRGATLADAVSTSAAGVVSWDRDPLKMTAVIEGALAPTGVRPTRALLDLAFDTGKNDRWGHGRMRAYLRSGVLGTSLGGDRGAALARRKPGAEWVGPNALVALRVDLDAARDVLRYWDARLALVGNAKRLEAEIDQVAAGLRVRLSLSR